MDVQNSSFQRRLRMLLAQEFAARGYFLDAESFYDRIPLQSLETDELELLLRIAMASKETALAALRLDALEKIKPQSEILHACRAAEDQGKDSKFCMQRWWQWLRRKYKR